MLDYDQALKDLQAEGEPDPVKARAQYCRDNGALVVISREELKKPFFSRTPAHTVGVALEVTGYKVDPDSMFCIFPEVPGGSIPVIGLVEKDKLAFYGGVKFDGVDQILRLNERYDSTYWEVFLEANSQNACLDPIHKKV